MLEKVPVDKLSYVIQIMKGVNGLIANNKKMQKKKYRIRHIYYASNRKDDEGR